MDKTVNYLTETYKQQFGCHFYIQIQFVFLPYRYCIFFNTYQFLMFYVLCIFLREIVLSLLTSPFSLTAIFLLKKGGGAGEGYGC